MALDQTPDGMIVTESFHGLQQTVLRLVVAIEEHGMTVMGRIDHAAAATEAGLNLRPTELLLFGNPRGGTPLMQASQTAGIDLPLKMLVWHDGDRRTWVGYNDPHWIAARHGASGAASAPVTAMAAALAAITAAATGAAS